MNDHYIAAERVPFRGTDSTLCHGKGSIESGMLKAHRTTPSSLLPLAAIKSPIFSQVASPSNHSGSQALQSHCFLTCKITLFKYWYREDLVLPVGIFMESHIRVGSLQSVPGTLITAGEIA